MTDAYVTVDPLDATITLAADIPCHQCGKPADMIGTGHRDEPCPTIEPPPPWFKCATCHQHWQQVMVEALAEAEYLECECCGGYFETIDEFSIWRPV